MAPNILFIITDQQRQDHLGCYGNDIVQTPHIDGLAREGLRFDRHYVNNPLCMPARSIVLTGQYSRTCCGSLGNFVALSTDGGWIMPEYPRRGRPHLKDTTLPEILRENGYHTAAIGKWHIHSWPHDVGFDYYLIPRVYHVHVGQKFTENGGPEFIPEGFTVDFEAEKVGEFLQSQNKILRFESNNWWNFSNTPPDYCVLCSTYYNPNIIKDVCKDLSLNVPNILYSKSVDKNEYRVSEDMYKIIPYNHLGHTYGENNVYNTLCDLILKQYDSKKAPCIGLAASASGEDMRCK